MGQDNIYKFLKQSPSSFFSINEVAECVGVSFSSAYASLKKMVENGELAYKIIETPAQGPPKKMYAFIPQDDNIVDALHSFATIKERKDMAMTPADFCLQLCILAELKKLNMRLLNEK